MIKEFIKKLAFRHTNFGAPKYSYNIEPEQLAEIISSIVALSKRGHPLNLLEIGVARGMTTRFIAEHIEKNRLDVAFYCLDTFSSFTAEDVDYEIQNRGKSRGELAGFSYNDFETWKRNFSEYDFVKAIQCDVADFDFAEIEGGIDFVFLDVDLYQPTLKALRNMRGYLNAGAIILVDDVADNNSWDGAFEAFFEFVKEEGIDYEVVGNRCGKIIWQG
ncbi:class I SAM-dependent methyltransferase [Shimia sp. R11_0]|uniref:class I SAM-dependent methyltransferase n=1 Tax=Shimia sp. R11_0 TaxID=2821096 RepID=UPI001ADCEF52|nr:class I SAM-dependent methyltransferase [Shimia sp. R11_0]MBO9477710.1 class I SAM-dependent methyltransferase [Shimia sp. R11_0]